MLLDTFRNTLVKKFLGNDLVPRFSYLSLTKSENMYKVNEVNTHDMVGRVGVGTRKSSNAMDWTTDVRPIMA